MSSLLPLFFIPICLVEGHPRDTSCVFSAPPPPPLEEMCLSVTSYWVWDEEGDLLPGWNGQCNEDCSKTGALFDLPKRVEEYPGDFAACIYSWTKLKGFPTRVVKYREITVYCVDNFGDPDYWIPFYHDYYEQWVIPLDLLADGVQELVCEWSIEWGQPTLN